MNFQRVTKIAKACLRLSLLSLAAVGAHAQPKQRPNIALVLADDLGWKDVGYQGSDFYEPPNIDRLAKAVVSHNFVCL